MDLTRKTFHIRTFGCQMNENDSERIAGILSAHGARKVDSEEEADILILNTCAVRAKSEDKLDSCLGRLKALKRRRPIVLGVAGCVAQLRRGTLLERRPFVDFVVGPDNYLRLPEILACPGETGVVADRWSVEWQETPSAQVLRESAVSAYVTIMEGCDNFCAYCVVPFTRGREKYRPLSAVMAEVEDLGRRGYKEIQLLGQNVNSYRDPDGRGNFAELLRGVAGVEGPEWVRFLTSHPKNFSRDVVAAMAASPRICRRLHLPLQSGSTSVLARMNRGYTREDYLEKVEWLRERMPEIGLSTDIIVGFPGETETEFRETLAALETIRFVNIFSFRYSPRPGTAAARGADDVPLEIKRRRLIEVQALQKRIQIEIHRRLVGRHLRVLIEGTSRKDPAVQAGRTEGGQVVNIPSPHDTHGRFLMVEIVGAGPYSLKGAIVGRNTIRP